jgi:hypothetical protein
MMDDYEYLSEKFAKDRTKIDVINGLLMAQVICSRKLIEGHNEGILDVMNSIVRAIEVVKNQE